jgi:hypothetical protein
MGDAIEHLSADRLWDQAEALTVIADAVWSVTMVDAALVRLHPGAYDRMLASRSPAERRLIEETMAGLRFVRNRMGHDADLSRFVEPGTAEATATGSITGWTWKSVPEPELTGHSSHAWQIARHHGYQAQLAGHTTEETFGRAATFLRLAAASTTSITDEAHVSRRGR